MHPDEMTAPPVDDLIDAVQQHHWPVAVGLGIALALYAANRANLLKKVPSKYTPAVAAVLGILSAIGAQLITGISWEEAIGKGFLAGAAATGLWEMVLKHVLKFPEQTNLPVAPEPDGSTPEGSTPEAEPEIAAVVPIKKKAKAATKPTEAIAASSETPASPAPETPAPKKRGRPRKNPEA